MKLGSKEICGDVRCDRKINVCRFGETVGGDGGKAHSLGMDCHQKEWPPSQGCTRAGESLSPPNPSSFEKDTRIRESTPKA
jgi:hypothetical protein